MSSESLSYTGAPENPAEKHKQGWRWVERRKDLVTLFPRLSCSPVLLVGQLARPDVIKGLEFERKIQEGNRMHRVDVGPAGRGRWPCFSPLCCRAGEVDAAGDVGWWRPASQQLWEGWCWTSVEGKLLGAGCRLGWSPLQSLLARA